MGDCAVTSDRLGLASTFWPSPVTHLCHLLGMAIGEAVRPQNVIRQPETSSEMVGSDCVNAFHGQGEVTGALLPVYHFNAQAILRLRLR